MSAVEVNIGTEFGAKNCKSSSSELAFEAVSCANGIVSHITNREADSKFKTVLSESDFLRHMDNQSAIRMCAKLIICLMQISASMDLKQRSPVICVDVDHYGNLKDTSVVLLETTMRLRQLFDPAGNIIDTVALYHEILNSTHIACVIATKFGETDLEPYVSQMLFLIERGWD